jgi:hypothetical protein
MHTYVFALVHESRSGRKKRYLSKFIGNYNVLNLTGGRRLEQNSWMFFGCKAGYVSGLV